MHCLQLSYDHCWQVNFFHLDEYIGISEKHPASFGRYLKERLVEKLPSAPRSFHFVKPADGDAEAECKRLNEIIKKHPIDVAFVGIGENGHLAFNDPPADFATKAPYIVVNLDEACRKQQLGEGWFPTLEAVPKQAISMSIQHIMAVGALVASTTCLQCFTEFFFFSKCLFLSKCLFMTCASPQVDLISDFLCPNK